MKVKCVCEAGLVVLRDATVLLTLWLVLNRDVENGNQPSVCVCTHVCECVCVCACVYVCIKYLIQIALKLPSELDFCNFPYYNKPTSIVLLSLPARL